MDPQYGILSMPGTGFFGMLVIGFLAGWIAERTMNRDHGILTNILVGIAGSFVGGTLAGLLASPSTASSAIWWSPSSARS